MGLETMLCDLAGLLSGLDYLPEQGCTIGWALQLPKFSGQEGLTEGYTQQLGRDCFLFQVG